MPNLSNKPKTESLPIINFSASHDQVSLLNEMSTKYTAFKNISDDLGEIKTSLQEISPNVATLAEQQELSNKIEEKQATAIKLVEYGKQVVVDLYKTANKLNAIHQKSPAEKLKAAQSLLTEDEALNNQEQYRFKKIEQALCNTCIIKSAGDETIKFQLGVLGNARKNNLLSESEFNHLVILRLKENNLLDDYRLRIEGDMILEQTHFGMCQAINNELSSDPDYQDSKNLFAQRLKGIDYELSLQKLSDNSWEKKGLEERNSLCNELEGFNVTAAPKIKNGLEEDIAFNLPEIEDTDPTYEANLALINQDLLCRQNIEAMKKVNLQLNQKRSTFVESMEELIPKDKSKTIIIDAIIPTPIEDIMKITLECPSRVSDREALRINFARNRAELKNLTRADEKYLKILEDPSSSNNGDNIHEETLRESKKNLAERDEKRKETKPCQLVGEELVNKYREVTTRRLENRKESIEGQLSHLENKYEKHFDEFSRLKLEQKHGNLTSDEKKQIRKKMFREEKRRLNEQLEKTNKQLALWERSETFIKNVYNEKADIIKQEKMAFSTEDLNYRDLVLKYNPNYEAQQQKIYVYRGGVYVLNGKTKSISTGLEKSDIPTDNSDNHSQSRLSANRVSYKEQFSALSAPSLFSRKAEKNNSSNQAQEKSSGKGQWIKIKRHG